MAIEDRISHLRRRLSQEELDAFFVSSTENRRYFSGFVGSAGYLLVTQDQALLATDFRYTEQAILQAPHYELVRISGGGGWLKEMVAASGARRIGFEGSDVSYLMHQSMTESLKALEPAPELVATPNLLDQIRAIKEPEEIAVLEHAIRISDLALQQVSPTIRPGQTEQQIAWKLELAMRELGAEALAFDTIVAAGPNAARPHHHPTDYSLQEGDVLYIDMGARYQGYHSDMTRAFSVGRPRDELFRRVYDTVLAAQKRAEETIRTGMTGEEADSTARKVIEEAGFGETFGHSLGHGIGLAVHEWPRVSPRAEGIIEDGMVFSVEPGIYITGWGGVRIEDLVVMEQGKPRILTQCPKEDLINIGE